MSIEKSLTCCALVLGLASAVACGDDAPSDPKGPGDSSVPNDGPPSGQTRSDGGVDAARPSGTSQADASQAPDSAEDASVTDPRFGNAPKLPACDGTAQVQTLHSQKEKIPALGLVGDTLYYAAFDEGVFALPTAGGTPKLVSETSAYDLATVGKTIFVPGIISTGDYWTQEDLEAGKEGEFIALDMIVQSGAKRMYSWAEVQNCGTDTTYFKAVDESADSTTYYVPCGIRGIAEDGEQPYAAVSKDGVPSGIYRADTEEGSAKRLVEEDDLGFTFTIAGGYFYFTKRIDIAQEYLMRAPVAGGSAEVVAGPFSVNAMASRGDDVFISELKNGCLYKLDAKTNTLTAFAKPGIVEDMAFDDTHLYVATFNGTLARIPL